MIGSPGPVLELHILGDPMTKGSYVPIPKKKGGIYFKPDNREKLRAWEKSIGLVTRLTLRDAKNSTDASVLFPSPVPVAVDVTFYLKPPLPTSYPRWWWALVAWTRPVAKSDVDKLSRALLDVLVRERVMSDDGQVTALRARKRYARHECPAGADVRISVDLPSEWRPWPIHHDKGFFLDTPVEAPRRCR